jgi:hypothetical protein
MAALTGSTTARERLIGLAAVLVSVLLLTACPMQDQSSATPAQPRFTKLDAFDPHRQGFECKHEADVNPASTPEAEALFQQGMAATSNDLWPEDRDHKKAAQLWAQAAGQGHWKAQFNLAGLYLQGLGVPQDADKALELTEDLMRKGVPAAWDNMGAYYMGGVGPLKQDATVAYAFWQKAADMGSMAAQAYLGEKLLGTHDEPPSFWGNRTIGLKMLECGFAQGSGKAAFELGLTLDVEGQTYPRALSVLHESVKLGSEDGAGYLFGSFDDGDALVEHRIDKARAERYQVLADALWHNPDLRFPNLDKVLPLPPADLPKWDGNKQTLIDAAKPLVALPAVKPTPGSQSTGRAHIPQGHVLASQVTLPPGESAHDNHGRPWSLKSRQLAHFTGYWVPLYDLVRGDVQREWNETMTPMHYKRGEAFPSLAKYIEPGTGEVSWHYLGEPVPVTQAPNPRVAQGIARGTRVPEPLLRCNGAQPCPRTGVWAGQVPKDHPLARLYNRWDRFAYVQQDRPFPNPHDQCIDIAPQEVSWLWLDNANQRRRSGIVDVTLSDLHEAQSKAET